MSTQQTRRENGTDALLPPHRDLGIDAEGYHHAQDRRRGVIHRVDPDTGARERVTDLRLDAYPAPGNALNAYIAHVAEEIGWAERVPTDGDWLGTCHCPQHDRPLVSDAAGCLHCPACTGAE